jgi:DNA processing protein
MLGVGARPDGAPESGTRRPDGARDAAPPTTADRTALAVLASVQGLGPVGSGALIATLGSPAAVLARAAQPGGVPALVAASVHEVADGTRRHALSAGVAELVVEAGRRRDEILRGIERLGLRIVAIGDPEYPARLRAIEFPPTILFVRGDPRAFTADQAVAIVGTRRPSDAGRRTASRIATAVARAGALVVSGLAVGIDGAAHAAAVQEGRPTVAFIGSGHARLFPAIHDRLADAIVEGGGAVVSEYSPETEPTRGTFPRRNRLISGSADAVVVVQAGARSGALVTASWALEQGRECFVVPGPIDAPTSAGCNGFLRAWPGLARVVSGIPQLLEDLGMSGEAGLEPPPVSRTARSGAPASTAGSLDPESVLAAMQEADRPVAAAIVRGASTVDEVVAVTGRPVGAVLAALTRLEGDGFVVGRHGRYRVADLYAGAPLRVA